MLPIIGAVLEAGLKIIDKVIPDPQAKAAAQLELMKLNQAGEFKQMEADLQLALGQIEVNKIEAASDSFWKSGWRPGSGWICNVGLAYTFLLQPLLAWYSSAHGIPVPPEIDMSTLLILLGSLLGIGGMRTTEKIKGKA